MEKKNPSSAVESSSCQKIRSKTAPFILVLKKGEPILPSILQCLEAAKIPSASLSGVGAVENPILAYYNLQTKKYEEKTFQGIFEIAAMDGNVSYVDGKPFAHVHMVIGNAQHEAFAGHLMSGDVGVTAEISVIPLQHPIHRSYDPEVGLNLINPP